MAETAWPARIGRVAAVSAARLVRRGLDRVFVERGRDLPRAVSRTLWLEDLGYAHAHRKSYAPSPWRVLERMLPVESVGPADVFLDFGCGMGRVMLEAAERYPFARVVGVELVPQLADAARSLLSANERRFKSGGWEVATADVLDWQMPDDVTVAYLHDPFTGPVFDAVASQLEASVDRNPRRVRIVYLTPVEMQRLMSSGRVVPVRRGTTGLLTAGGTYEYFVGDLLPAGRA